MVGVGGGVARVQGAGVVNFRGTVDSGDTDSFASRIFFFCFFFFITLKPRVE